MRTRYQTLTVSNGMRCVSETQFRNCNNGSLSSWTGTYAFESCSFGTDQSGLVQYAGVRSSEYGIKPFPTKERWADMALNMVAKFPGSIPTAVWIIGAIDNGNCNLEFPSDGNSYRHITFASQDKHETYLDYFDHHGIKVYLQVEPGQADVKKLIDIVLRRYGHHPSVVGFGVDVEWFHVSASSANESTPIGNQMAHQWESKVKSYNSNYRLFLKHWLPSLMPSSYRGDIVFIDDSQGFSGLKEMVDEFDKWADSFPDNIVMYQVGYDVNVSGNNDFEWWHNLVNPPQVIGKAIAEEIHAGNPDQDVGIIWVDFSLDRPELNFRTH